MFNIKQVSTFLLGAAAGYAIFKYNSMSEEEKQDLKADLEAKANKLKEEAETLFNNVLKKREDNDNKQTNV